MLKRLAEFAPPSSANLKSQVHLLATLDDLWAAYRPVRPIRRDLSGNSPRCAVKDRSDSLLFGAWRELVFATVAL